MEDLAGGAGERWVCKMGDGRREVQVTEPEMRASTAGRQTGGGRRWLMGGGGDGGVGVMHSSSVLWNILRLSARLNDVHTVT